jgi:uncharacterized membrane protein
MDNEIWAKVHGASVHFPIALVLCSAVMDISGKWLSSLQHRRSFHTVGYWTLLFGALGTVPAVVSGLLMTHGVVLGHDQLRLHHLFAWPAFAMIIGAASWRVAVRDRDGNGPPGTFVALSSLAAILVMAAGYWGGELLLSS